MDTETQKVFQALAGKLSKEDIAQLQQLMDQAIETNHPTVLATRRFEAAMKTAADEIAKTEILELMGALDEKVATHGALSQRELTALFRKLLAHMAT